MKVEFNDSIVRLEEIEIKTFTKENYAEKSDYLIKEKISEGANGIVHRAEDKKYGQTFAIKKI